MTAKTPIFEVETCSRCCGSGKFSFNQMHGDRCYGCGGVGTKRTKRGKAAADWFIEQRSVRADAVVVGQVVFMDMHFWRGFKTVTEVATTATGQIRISCVRKGELNSITYPADKLIPAAITEERKQELIAMALQYQASLTKQGVPSKKKSA